MTATQTFALHSTISIALPATQPKGVVVVARNVRNAHTRRHFATEALRESLAVVTVRLLDAEETAADAQGAFGFDIGMLGHRLISILDSLREEPALGSLPLGLFASGTAAAAALVAAVERPAQVRCVISCAGRPDLAGPILAQVRVPVLLIVDGGDLHSIRANRSALEPLGRHAGGLVAVPRAPHLRPAGTNALVASLAVPWLADVLFGPNA